MTIGRSVTANFSVNNVGMANSSSGSSRLASRPSQCVVAFLWLLQVLALFLALSSAAKAQEVKLDTGSNAQYHEAMSLCREHYDRSAAPLPPEGEVYWVFDDEAARPCHVTGLIAETPGPQNGSVIQYGNIQYYTIQRVHFQSGWYNHVIHFRQYWFRLGTETAGVTGTPSCQVAVGNPINSITGNKFESIVDLTGTGLQFARYYNSSWGTESRWMGKGWSHSYSSTLIFDETNDAFRFVDDSGAPTIYQKSGSVWTSTDDGGGTIQIAGTGFERIPSQGNGILKESYGSLGELLTRTHADETYSLEYAYVPSGGDPAYVPVSIKNRLGRELRLGYNSKAQLTTVTPGDGNSVTYEYATGPVQGLLSKALYSDGTGYLYEYTPTNNPPADRLLKITGLDGVLISQFIYDGLGTAYATWKAGNQSYYKGQKDPYIADQFNVYQWTTKVNSITTAMIAGKRRPIAFSNIPCKTNKPVSTITYFPNGRVKSERDFRYYDTEYTYDAGGREISRKVGKSGSSFVRRTEQDWHPTLNVVTERRIYGSNGALVQKSTYAYNSRGQRISQAQTDPVTSSSRVATTSFCEQADVALNVCPVVGLVKEVNGPRTDVNDLTQFTYRSADHPDCANPALSCPFRKGDLWKTTDAIGGITQVLKYDASGRPLSVQDKNSVVTDYVYNSRGYLLAQKVRGADPGSEADDKIYAIAYTPLGDVQKITQPNGNYVTFAYDTAFRLKRVTDNEGNYIEYTLDRTGNRIKEETRDASSVLKRTLSRVFNAWNQLTTVADASSNPTDYTYDLNGNLLTLKDALGRTTENGYDPINRLNQIVQNTGGIAALTKMKYDAQDNLTQVTDPKGLNTNYTYNGLGDLTQLASPDTGTTVYTYDSAGNRATQTDARNQTSTYSYDVLNRLTGIAYATSSLNVGYTYDATQAVCQSGETFSTGRLTRLADASGSTQYCYDRFGNLVRKVQTTNGIALTVRYAYTLAGQLSSVTYPDGATASYVRDAQGRTTQVNVQRAGAASEVLLNQASYHPFGPVAGWTYGNGRQLLRPLNQNYQPTAIQDASTGGLSVGFAYDPVGNLTQLTPAASTTPLVKFDYDALSRLTAFKDGPTDVAIESYTFDATGNRQSFTNASGTQAYTYPTTSHRLSQVGTTARSYDAAGNTTAIGGTAKEFVYDDTGRMSQVKQNAIVQRSYAYNGKGEQVRKSIGTANTYTLYDEAGHWLGDYDNTGTALQQAIWLDDLPVGLIANGNQLHYIEPDHLSTPRVVIEVARNAPVWTWDLKSEAFGNSVPNQNPDGDATPLVFDMRFPGQRYDANTGLNYNYFRDYDSSTGRYTTSDPIGLHGGLSTYGYAIGSPLTGVDPLGLQSCNWIVNLPFLQIGMCSYPGWSPTPGVTHPTKDEVTQARECPKQGGDCADLIYSIDVLVRDMKFRRWDMQRYATGSSGKLDPGHVIHYNMVKADLIGLVSAAKARSCPYNPEADTEITLGPGFPTPRY